MLTKILTCDICEADEPVSDDDAAMRVSLDVVAQLEPRWVVTLGEPDFDICRGCCDAIDAVVKARWVKRDGPEGGVLQ